MTSVAHPPLRGLAALGLPLLSSAFLLAGGDEAAKSEEPLPAAVVTAPVPEWADSIPAPTAQQRPERESLGSGVHYLLSDCQLHLDATKASYQHVALRFLTEAGIREQSSIQVTYDPSYQQVVFHQLRLWRGGQPVERLKQTTFRTLRRENNLEWNLLDGRVTLLAVLEDIRIGDVLEYAYTLTGANPIFGGRYCNSFLLGWTVPLDRSRLRILFPLEQSLQRRLQGPGASEPAERVCQGYREWLWDRTNTPPVQLEGEQPVWYRPLPEVALSQYASWTEVAHWAANCYCVTGTDVRPLIPQFGEWQARPDARERALAALDFVQNEIRYFGLELGAGSHKPSPPDHVLQRRFGDCKDKAVLLCALLKHLGLEARPALVNSCLRRQVDKELPSPLAFNHVIVVAEVSGETVWLDPTLSHQRGPLHQRFIQPYGMALPVAETTVSFQSLAGLIWDTSRCEFHERFDLSHAGGPAQLTIRSAYFGRDGDACRAHFAASSKAEWERQRLNSVAQRFPETEQQAACEIEESPDGSVVSVTERYLIRNLWRPDPTQTNRLSATFTAAEFDSVVRQPATVLRRTPLGVPYPVDLSKTIEVLLPKEWQVVPVQKTLEDPYLRFTSVSTYSNRTLTLRYHLQSLQDAVPQAEVSEHLQLRRQIAQQLGQTVYDGVDVRFSPNRPLFALAALWSALAVALGICGYRWRPVPAPPPEARSGRPTPCGLGGWLLLPCLGLAMGLFQTLMNLAQYRFCFNANAWRSLTEPGASAYHALWRPLLLTELLGNIALLALLTLAVVLLLQRRASLPAFMIALYLTSLLMVGISCSLTTQIPAAAAQQKPEQLTRAMNRAIVAACIWIPYFTRSRRVRNTFRK